MTIRPDQAKELLQQKIKKFFSECDCRSQSATEGNWLRFAVEIEEVDLLRWLNHQSQSVKLYWQDRENKFAMAGAGAAHSVTDQHTGNYSSSLKIIKHSLKNAVSPLLRYYGGMAFRRECQPEIAWQPFGTFLFVVPRFEIYKEKSRHWLVCNHYLPPKIDKSGQLVELLRKSEKINFESVESLPAPTLFVSRFDSPDYKRWERNIFSALRSFKKQDMEKIVLARKSVFSFNEILNPFTLLSQLSRTAYGGYCFGFQPQRDTAFIGATPEQLYQRCGRHIISEAVAGTRPRGESAVEDQLLEKELISSDKDFREHRFVVNSIFRSLRKMCLSVNEPSPPTILKLNHLQHLYNQLTGQLKEHIDDGDIINELHPTPAVGGFPREAALEQIGWLEPFDRGWYAAPVGWISEDAAEFVVAIRSGLVAGQQLHLYSGAGIVEGSSPSKEWEEIENKISNFIKTLGQSKPDTWRQL